MTEIAGSTRIAYPLGAVSGRSEILLARRNGEGRLLVVTEETPFHPVDHVWPDQPADRGTVTVDGRTFAVVDVVTGVRRLDGGDLFAGKEIPVRRGEPGWAFLVVHVLDAPDVELEGKEAALTVDEEYRLRLCASHTACHLMSLALNQAAAGLWKKEVRRDSLGNPNLDKMAIERSTITPEESVDRYRFGKSLRKDGFDSSAFLESLGAVAEEIEKTVATWLAAGGDVTMDPGEGRLDSLRIWRCDLGGGRVAEIPCGGSHLQSLRQLAAVRVTIERDPEQPEITVRTVAELR